MDGVSATYSVSWVGVAAKDRHGDRVMVTRNLVSVVDDDVSVRESLPDLLRLFGFEVRPFASAEDFLASESRAVTGCLVLDVGLPGMTGPELKQELARRNQDIPIVFITANSDDKALARLLGRDAADCLIKPFSESAIVEAVKAALAAR
jgi:FixJ family two-component response regulator